MHPQILQILLRRLIFFRGLIASVFLETDGFYAMKRDLANKASVGVARGSNGSNLRILA